MTSIMVAAPAQDLASFLGLVAQVQVVAPEEHRSELGAGVFQGEIKMPGQGLSQVGDFAAHPDESKMGLQALPDLPGEGAHRVDVRVFPIHGGGLIHYTIFPFTGEIS